MKKLLSFLALIVSVLAVFAITYTNNADAATVGEYEAATSIDTSKTYHIVSTTTAGALQFAGSNSGTFYTSVEANTDSLKFKFELISGNQYYIFDGSKYVSWSSSNTATSSEKSDAGKWTVTIDQSTGVVTIDHVGTPGRKLQYNRSNPRFAAYTSTQASIYLIDTSIFGSISDQLTKKVAKYRNDGVYTKKSNIFLTSDAEHDISTYFHGSVAQDRTTYYNGEYLLMGDIDGGFDKINSGYRTDGTDMKHFTYLNGEVVDDYTVKNTTLHEFYVTLNKLASADYFAEWESNEYKVSGQDDEYLADFLAFAAPCLTDLVLTSNYIVVDKLVVVEDSITTDGEIKRNYLAFQIYATSTNSGALTREDLLLAEARVFAENESFDETRHYNLTVNITGKENGTVTHDATSTTGIVEGTEVTFTIVPNEGYYSVVKVNDSAKDLDENNKITVTINKNTTINVEFNQIQEAGGNVIYTCNFETGYTASSTYNNSTAKLHGPTGQQWAIISGTPSTSNVIEGSKSIQMRYYESLNGIVPSMTSNFIFEGAKKLTFKASNSSGNNVKVEISTDNSTWETVETFTLSTTAQEFTCTLSETGANVYIRFTFEWAGTDKSKVTIDEIVVSK